MRISFCSRQGFFIIVSILFSEFKQIVSIKNVFLIHRAKIAAGTNPPQPNGYNCREGFFIFNFCPSCFASL